MGKIVLRLLLAIVVIAGCGWVLAFALNLTAFFVSPAMVARFECPPGSTVESEYIQQSYNQPGEKTYTFQCLDQNGQVVPTLPNEQITAAEYRYFYPAGVLIMAVVVFGWYAVSFLVKSMRRKPA